MKKYLLKFLIPLLPILFLQASLNAQDDTFSALKITSQPKNSWETGIHFGNSFIIGEVDSKASFGGGIYGRKALDHVFSIRLDAGYHTFSGKENSTIRVVDAFNYGFTTDWLPEYKSSALTGDLSLLMSLNNIGYKLKKKKKWSPYLYAGLGLINVETEVMEGTQKFDVYDFKFNKKQYFAGYINAGLGLGYRLSDRLSIYLDHKVIRVFGSGNDLLDGVEWGGTLNDRVIPLKRDLLHYTGLRIGYSIGDRERISEPLWWVSPFNLVIDDLAEVKSRPVIDLTDDDEDGVINMIDQEPETENGYPVDTRGVALDSDGDGIADGKDDEPYSPIGYEIDGKGVAQVPEPTILNEEDVKKLIKDESANKEDNINNLIYPVYNLPVSKYSKERSFEIKEIAPHALTFGDVDEVLRPAISNAEFGANDAKEFMYFQVKSDQNRFKGYAIVTSFEKIYSSGKPLKGKDRFDLKINTYSYRSWIDYVFPFRMIKGNFRFFVFLVIGDDVELENKPGLSKNQIINKFREANTKVKRKLHERIKTHPLPDSCQLMVLVYEYEQLEDEKDGRPLKLYGTDVEDHLNKAGIWNNLFKK